MGSRKMICRGVSYIVLGGVVLIDQLCKFLLCYFLPEGHKVSIISSFFEICHTENSGIIFGIGKQWGQEHNFLMAIGLFGIAIVSAMLMWTCRERMANQNHLDSIILPLFIGGSLGNFIDRLNKGAVVDWINSSFFTGPVNISDIAILSALILFGFEIFNAKLVSR